MSAAAVLLLDTNILVYAYDRNEPMKGPAALNLASRLFASSWPILSTHAEFYWTATRKLVPALTHDQAFAEIQHFQAMGTVVPVTWAVIEKALQLAAGHQMPLWDAQLLAAAILNGATHILSEDFQHRRTIEGVTFLNPFAADFDPAEILAP